MTTRIWFNHWFSTAYSIINLVKEGENDFTVIGTNENALAGYKCVCDEWYQEPILKGKEYVEFCLEFCQKHKINMFVPRRHMLDISREKHRFLEIGVMVMVDDYEVIKLLNNKEEAYRLFREKQIGTIPDYVIANNTTDFEKGYKRLSEKYEKICFKFVSDEGGKSFRLIDNEHKGYAALYKKQTTRITFSDAISALSERNVFNPVMLMPYLPGDEISVDCLSTTSGLIAIPRIKDKTRIERIEYNPEIIEICSKFYSEIGLDMPCNIQFKMLYGVPFFLEVNTRMSGGVQMACLASGVNIPNIAVNKLLGIEKKWHINKHNCFVTQTEMPICF